MSMDACRAKLYEMAGIHQCGFVSGRCILDLSTMLRRVFDSQKVSGLELIMVSIDIKKAFDSLRRDALTHMLNQVLKDEHPDSVQYLIELYTEQFLTLRRGDRLKKVATGVGVRQGDPASPALYNAVVGLVLTQASKEWSTAGHGFVFKKDETTHHLSILAYADDTTLLATSVESMNFMLKDTDRRLRKLGLEIHPGKSEAVWSKSPEATISSPLRIRNKEVPLVKETTVVGTTWGFGHRPDSQLQHLSLIHI